MYPSLSGMHCGTVTYFIAVATMFYHIAGELFMTSQIIESKVGDTTYFNCSTDLESWEIFWYHGDKYIYTGHGIHEPYNGRFESHQNASIGFHNLVINSVEPSDAGEYTCVDDDGSGTSRSATLVVIDNDPDCQSNIQAGGVIGQNVFNIPPDEVHLTCNVTFYGNIPPQMEWKKVGGHSAIRENVTSHITSDKRLIYTLKLKGDISLDEFSYVCQTTRSAKNQYKCNSETIKVLYFIGGNMTQQNVVRGGEITCTASNNTFPCISQWYHGNYSCPLSCDGTITTHLLGEYLCTIKCNVRGSDYSFTAQKTIVVEAKTSISPSTWGTVAVSVMVIIVITSVVVSIAVYVVRYNKRVAEQNAGDKDGAHIPLILRQRPHEFEVELLHKIKKEGTPEEKEIRGVTILGGKLFLLHKGSSGLKVYDCKNFNVPCKLLDVKEVVSAFDICSCKKNNRLYIMDKKNHYLDFKDNREFAAREILKFSTEGIFSGKWSTEDDSCGFLSATSEGNVILTVQDKHMLLEYSSDGELVRHILLIECIRPWHAIKEDNDRYIVSHGTYDHLHRVCLVDEKGNVLKLFGREMGSTENQLHIPYYLAVASNGRVMVADLCNNRVLLLNKNLKFKTKIVPIYKQGFRSPRRICLDEDTGLLVVVIGAGIPRKKIIVEKCDLREEKELIDILTKNDYPKETSSGEAHDSRKETVDDDMTELHDLLRKLKERLKKWMKEVEVVKRIEEDCRLLVFDIKLLMQTSNG